MTIWTLLDVPRSDYWHVRNLGACPDRFRLWINATQCRSGKFNRWYDNASQRTFQIYTHYDERQQAKDEGAYWDPDRKAWFFSTSRTDGELPDIIRGRLKMPELVCVEVPRLLKDVAKTVGFRWNAQAKMWVIPRNRVRAALAAVPELRTCVVKDEAVVL